MCFLLQVSGSKVRSHPVTVYPPKKPFMETEPESRAQGSLPTIELSGKVSPWASVGPVPHPSPEFPVSPALLRGGPAGGGGCGWSAGGRLCAPSPLTSWGAVPAAPSVQSSPRGSPGSVPAPSHTRWLGRQGRQCRWPGPWAPRCPTDTAWAGRGLSCRAGVELGVGLLHLGT